MTDTVIYEGATDEQVRWGACDDPRGVLTPGVAYEVEQRDVHSWHTKLTLRGVPGRFNSVCFKEQR